MHGKDFLKIPSAQMKVKKEHTERDDPKFLAVKLKNLKLLFCFTVV